NLQLNRLICLQHCAEQRRGWLAYLEVDWPVLNLDDDIVVELAVEGMEVVVGGASAVSFRITPVQVMVVNEGAVEQDSGMRTKRSGNHVGSISGAAAILRRAGAAFGIRFDYESGEVGDPCIDCIDCLLPPCADSWIKRIKRVELSHRQRTAEIYGDGQLHSPGTKRVCNSRELRNEICAEDTRVGVDVVYCARINAN